MSKTKRPQETRTTEDTKQLNLTIGQVSGCERLNIRSGPSKSADVVGVVENGTKLVIDESKSEGDFYKVCADSGIDGFCMKNYVITC